MTVNRYISIVQVDQVSSHIIHLSTFIESTIKVLQLCIVEVIKTITYYTKMYSTRNIVRIRSITLIV